MSNVEHYDAVVLGSGEAGKYISWHLASGGKRVALVECKYIGGSCPNIACLPSKNVIHTAKVAFYETQESEYGLSTDTWHIDMPAVRDRKRRMVQGLVDTHLANFKKSGAELIMGHGRFIAPKTLEVALNDGGTRMLQGDMVFLSTGTRATIDAIPGLAESAPMTHVEALELDVVPEHLLILGGGYVGLEFAQALSRFESKVTVIERSARVLPREDPDISEAIESLFEDEGIEIIREATVVEVKGRSGERVHVKIRSSDGANAEVQLEGSHLLVATGRTPNTQNIGLDIAGVASNERGYIKVNAKLETTAPGVWAVGDCAGSPHFTHIAFDDFRVIRENLAGRSRVTTGRQVPFCLFTDPEFARIGLSESEAKSKNIPYRLARIPMEADLRTRTLSETRGFLKALVSADSDHILGFAGFGSGAGEIMAPVQLAMKAGLPYTDLRDMVLTHPTLVEGLVALFATVHPA